MMKPGTKWLRAVSDRHRLLMTAGLALVQFFILRQMLLVQKEKE
jgi:hypothetical protein